MTRLAEVVSTRRRILDAASPLLHADSRASVAALAAAAGVSRATFHRVIGSRADLVAGLRLEPDPDLRARILAAAVEMIGRTGLEGLSMEELAAAGEASRASLYRLFPGKAALFRELVRTYSPFEAVARTVQVMGGRPAAEVMPALARAVAAEMAGRTGMIRAFLTGVTTMSPDAMEGVEFALSRGIWTVLGYVTGEMSAGRLRAMSPVLALQAFIGPIVLHLLTRELAESHLDLDVPLDDAMTELADAWVRAMAPPTPAGSR